MEGLKLICAHFYCVFYTLSVSHTAGKTNLPLNRQPCFQLPWGCANNVSEAKSHANNNSKWRLEISYCLSARNWIIVFFFSDRRREKEANDSAWLVASVAL